MAIIKNKGDTVLNQKLFDEINILKIVKYLLKYIFLLFQYILNGFRMMPLIGIINVSWKFKKKLGKKTKK